MSLLGPAFLVKHISTISLLLGAVCLVVFSDFMNKKFVFPLSDLVKTKVHKGIKAKMSDKKGSLLAKYLSETLATFVFLFYCYFGSYVLAEYLFSPILSRLKDVLIIVIIILFLLISYVVNTKRIRSLLMKT